MNILGIYGAMGWDSHNDDDWVHDSGATLFVDGNHICSIQEERLTKYKYDGNFPYLSISYCLSEANISEEDIDLVVIPSLGCKEFYLMQQSGDLNLFIKKIFKNAEVKIISHHEAHAYSSIHSCEYDDGCYLVIDGGGSNGVANDNQLFLEMVSFGYFNKQKNIFRQFNIGGAFGLYYQTWSHYIYCQKTNKNISVIDHKYVETFAGKVMGLSAYGSLKHLKNYKEYDFTDNGFPIVHFKTIPVDNNQMSNIGMNNLSADDKAAFLQKNFENCLVDYLNLLDNKGFLDNNICLTGGVFLNILANTKIKQSLKNKNIHITPFVNDVGLSFGAACYGCVSKKESINLPKNIALLGKKYNEEEYTDLLQNLDYKIFDTDLDLCKEVSIHLNDNKIIAWYQGRSEFGPRALGSRSILMNPKFKQNKNILNEKVKHREYWRPFAGVILEEYLNEYFEECIDNPYMLYSQTVRSEKINDIQAIVHKDNSCRIQTINSSINYKLSLLLNEFKKLSNIPVLLNTSFNDNGKPIIESPNDAIQAFLNMNIDYLILGNILIKKQ